MQLFDKKLILVIIIFSFTVIKLLVMFRIKKICKDKGISLAELADRMETSAESVSRTLSEKGNPTMKTLTKFSKALDVQVYELFEQSGDEVSVNGFIEINHKLYRINNFDELEDLYKNLVLNNL